MLGWSNAVKEELESRDERNEILIEQNRTNYKLILHRTKFSWYFMGPRPDHNSPSNFPLLFALGKTVPLNPKLFFSFTEAKDLHKILFESLEASSFISWQLDSVASFLN